MGSNGDQPNTVNDPLFIRDCLESFSFNLSAEFNQFYIQDEEADWELTDNLWTQEEGQDQLALAPGIIAVGTNRDRVVPVDVQITMSEPTDDFKEWDQIIECSINVACGHLLVFGCFDFDQASSFRYSRVPTGQEFFMATSTPAWGSGINAETIIRLYSGQAKTKAIA